MGGQPPQGPRRCRSLSSRRILLGSIGFLGLAICFAAAATFLRPGGPVRASGGSGTSAPPINDNARYSKPNPQLAGKVVHIQREDYVNMSIGLRAQLPANVKHRGERTTTDTWGQLDSAGNLTRFRSTTRLPDGTVTQDQLFDGSGEWVNWYGWMETDQRCSERLETGTLGTALSTGSIDDFKSRGFTQVPVPTDVGVPGTALAFQKRDAVTEPGYAHYEQTAFLDRTTLLDLGRLIVVITDDGHRTTKESSVASYTFGGTLPPGILDMPLLPACTGHHPAAAASPANQP